MTETANGPREIMQETKRDRSSKGSIWEIVCMNTRNEELHQMRDGDICDDGELVQ